MPVTKPKPDDDDAPAVPAPPIRSPYDGDDDLRSPYDDDPSLADPWGEGTGAPPAEQPAVEETAEDPAPKRARRATSR